MKGLFRNRTTPAAKKYDASKYTPVVRASICTGEKVAGFQSNDGLIHEVALFRTDKDLEAFRREYGITGEIKTVY